MKSIVQNSMENEGVGWGRSHVEQEYTELKVKIAYALRERMM